MSSVYRKKSGTYYLSVSYQGQRLTKSLGTKNYKTARSIKADLEKELLTQIIHGANPECLIFKDLMLRYLEFDHGWKDSTYKLNKRLLNGYIKTGFPKNKTTRAMTVRVVNSCNRWGFKNELITFKSMKVKHGKINSIGYIVNNSAYISDCNKLSKSNIIKLKNLKYFIIDCLRFKSHPSHFSVNEVLSILKEIRPKQTILTNLHSDLDYNILLQKMPINVKPAFYGLRLEL